MSALYTQYWPQFYGSVQLKKTVTGKGDGIETKLTIPIWGAQASLSTDNGARADWITPKEYYISAVSNNLVDFRVYPIKNYGKENFGDIPGGVRTLITIPQWSKLNGRVTYKTQAEFGLDSKGFTIGGRGVGEIKLGGGISFEAAIGVRGSLQVPPVFQAVYDAF